VLTLFFLLQRPNEPPKLGSSAHALALKAVLKRATIPCVLANPVPFLQHVSDAVVTSTIRVAPALYKAAAGDEAAFCTALERLLAQDGLRVNATDKEVAAARQRRELARDLDGIDAKNVVETEHGRPRRAAAATASDAMPQHVAVDAARGGGSGAADEPRKVASSPPGVRRRVLRVDEWEDDDA
jgi:hypothetical protein